MGRVSLKSKFIFPGMKIRALEMLRRMKLITSNRLPACASQQEKLTNTDRDIYTWTIFASTKIEPIRPTPWLKRQFPPTPGTKKAQQSSLGGCSATELLRHQYHIPYIMARLCAISNYITGSFSFCFLKQHRIFRNSRVGRRRREKRENWRLFPDRP